MTGLFRFYLDLSWNQLNKNSQDLIRSIANKRANEIAKNHPRLKGQQRQFICTVIANCLLTKVPLRLTVGEIDCTVLPQNYFKN